MRALKGYFENWVKSEKEWREKYGEHFDYLCR